MNTFTCILILFVPIVLSLVQNLQLNDPEKPLILAANRAIRSANPGNQYNNRYNNKNNGGGYNSGGSGYGGVAQSQSSSSASANITSGGGYTNSQSQSGGSAGKYGK